MRKNSRKKIFAYLSAMLILLSLLHSKRRKVDIEDCYEDVSYDGCYLYEEDNVYICSSVTEGLKLSQSCQESDIVVVDQSDHRDPNMKILSSCKVKDTEHMRQILEIIKKYCDSKETNWDRSIESMQNEWVIHNICSSLLIRNDRTDDVDLNNGDEIIYKSKILSKILRN